MERERSSFTDMMNQGASSPIMLPMDLFSSANDKTDDWKKQVEEGQRLVQSQAPSPAPSPAPVPAPARLNAPATYPLF